MNDIKQWFKNLIATNYFFTKLQNTEDISSPIVKAIKDKEIPILDPKQVSQPIVEALEAIREAVEDKEGVEEVTVKNITDAKADLTEVVSVLKDILNKEEKDIEFPEQKEVEFDTKPIIKALEKIEKCIPKYEQKEAADYTAILNKAVALLERPDEKTDLSKIEKSLDAIAKTEDMAVIAEWLKVIAVKEAPEFPDFPRDKDGIPYFNPTRVGSGGSGNSTTTNVAGEAINPATEETLQSTLFNYKLARLPVPGDTLIYLGYLDKDGNWYITEIDEDNGTQKYVKGTSGFTTAWSNRASNTYLDFDSIF